MSLINVQSVEQFNEIINDNPEVLMEFYASWCPHCHAFQPIMEEAAKKLNEEGVVVAQTEIDTFQDLASEFGVESIPTIFFIKNGQPVLKSTGERPVEEVYEFVKEGEQA